MSFGQANTKTLDHEPAEGGRIGVERRGFWPRGMERRRAERRGSRLFLGGCRIWHGAAVFRQLAAASLAPVPVYMRGNAG